MNKLRAFRRMMRGFRRLRDAGTLPSVVEFKDRIARTPCGPVYTGVRAESLQQYLIVHIVQERLQRALLTHASTREPLVCPLPSAWQRELRAAGVPVNGFQSTILFAGLVAGFLARGLGRGLEIARTLLTGPASGASLKGAACFVGTVAKQLPQPGPDGRSFDVFTWYASWSGRRRTVETLAQLSPVGPAVTAAGLPVVQVPDVLPVLDRLGAARVLGWWCGAVTLAVLDMMRGRWARAMLLSQAVQAEVVTRADAPPADEYLFHNSGWIYRPLWTYAAEARGSRILFYFYSTNIETFKAPEGYVRQAHMWHVASWPRYLVWDQAQADFVRREVHPDAVVEIVGPIWFYGSAMVMPDVPAASVAVFDVQAYRDFIYRVIVAERMYYTPAVVSAFLDDIRVVLGEAGRPMVFKHKRHLAGRAAHGRYRLHLKALLDDPGVVTIDPDIAAPRVVEACAGVISMPFTSTALIGSALGKPSIYYVPVIAPFGPVQKDDRAAHGIPVVSGREELRAWVAQLTPQA